MIDARLARSSVSALALLAGGCASAPSTHGSGDGGATVPTPALVSTADAATLPAVPSAVPATELEATYTCGPWKSADLTTKQNHLLDQRVSFSFVEGGRKEGNQRQGKLEAEKDGIALFFGAREMYQRADDLFERQAAKVGTFGGGYTTLRVEGPGAKAKIVAGFIDEVPVDRDLVAVAHGWFPDEDANVVDVAVFVSREALAGGGKAGCHGFAKQLLASVEPGARRLTYGAGKPSTEVVSYATFTFDLGADWITTGSMGIHDFARISFQKRGVFPVSGPAVELGFDTHPGDWASPGDETGRKKATLLGVPTEWRMTQEGDTVFGAWTISEATNGPDRAVASLWAGSAEERDEGVRFAESVKVTK